MLQLLLADRFGLRIHPEIRQSLTYELVTTPRASKRMTPVSGEINRVSTCTPHFSRRGVEIDSKGCPFPILVHHMSQMLGTDILDHTGMTGPYEFHLMYMPSQAAPGADEEYPDIVHAVSEQLGLELKKTQGPVTSWIVDHVERPTPN